MKLIKFLLIFVAVLMSLIIVTPLSEGTVRAASLKLVQPRLVITQIGVNAPLVPMRKTAEGRMAVPNNFTQVGWYELGAKPGEQGSAVLGAHVDNGGKIPGVFKNLKQLKPGDIFSVINESNELINFRVTQVKIYDRNQADTALVFKQTDKARLNLITCYGQWLPAAKTYAERLVVFSERLSS